MFLFDSCSLKKSVPVLLLLLVIAQIDLVSAAAWPLPLLSALHLTPVTDDLCRGVAAGIGCSIDVLVAFQLLRIFVRRALISKPDSQHG